jgi:hypothetical protein
MAQKTPTTGERKAARADIVPASLNEEARTVEIVWATETPVRRRTWEGAFYEVLSLNPKHVRMKRFASGRAPFLNEHRSWDPDAHVGVIESARIEDGKGIATVRFLKDDPDADKVWNKIRQGIKRSISVGYIIHRFVKVEGGDEKTPTFRAEDWEPLEASSVAIPADEASHIRSADERNLKMDETNETNPAPADNVRAERERVTEITKLVSRPMVRAAVGPEFLERVIADGTPLAKVREMVIDAVAERSAEGGPSEAPSGVGVERTRYTEHGQRGSFEDFARAAADALVMRAGIKLDKPHAGAVDLRSTSVTQIAQMALSRSGTRPGYLSTSGGDILRRAMHSSEFPLILSNAIGTAIRRGYETEPASHRQWVRSETVPDFNEHLRPILGSAPDLDEVAELGEYKNGTMDEDASSFRVRKFGKIIQLSWEILKNDKIGAFLRVQPALGQAARRKEADLVYQLLKENAGAGVTMPDGKTLFHADHGNLVSTPGALDHPLLSLARVLMRRQTAVGGGHLNVTPRFLIVSPENEDTAERLIAASTRVLTSSSESDQARWVSSLELVVESRLSATAAYLACDGNQVDTLVLALLDENAEGPTFEEEAEFRRDVYGTKIRHVFGAAALDWRGLVKMPING